jgi:hypothetical protein
MSNEKTFLEQVVEASSPKDDDTRVAYISSGKRTGADASFIENTQPSSNWPRKPGEPVLMLDELTAVSIGDLAWQARVKDVTPAEIHNPAAPYGLAFVDDVVVAPLEDEAWQQVVEMLQTKNSRPGVISFGAHSTGSEPLQRDEHDDLILPSFYDKELAVYPVPETFDPAAKSTLRGMEKQKIGRFIREQDLDSDDFTR